MALYEGRVGGPMGTYLQKDTNGVDANFLEIISGVETKPNVCGNFFLLITYFQVAKILFSDIFSLFAGL